MGRRTEGFSGSDVAVVVKDVLMQPIRMLREATHFRKLPNGRCPDADTGRMQAHHMQSLVVIDQ